MPCYRNPANESARGSSVSLMKTTHAFLGADLRLGHEGLIELAKKENVDLHKLPTGSAAVFINSEKSKLKTYSWNGVVSYIRTTKRGSIDMDVLDEIVKAISPNGHMDFKKAMRE